MNYAKMLLLFALLLLIACNNNEKVDQGEAITTKDSNVASQPVDDIDSAMGGCYSQVFNRDTVALQIEIKGNNVTGPLTYKLFQKDMNDGSIKAVVEDDIITGWYLFRSEGILSVRQVAWRIKGGQLWPAIGEVVQRNDTTLFARPDKLQFESARPFLKVNCTL